MGAHPHFLWANLFKRPKSDQTVLLDALLENTLFHTLSRSELAYLSTFIYERIYQTEEPIFEQDDRGMGMYVIVKGRVAIKTRTPEGDIHLTTLSEGDFFGELALVDSDNIRSASAIALERCVLAGFFKPDLMEILERKPSMGVQILFQLSTVLGKRLIETTEKITLLTRARGVSQIHENLL